MISQNGRFFRHRTGFMWPMTSRGGHFCALKCDPFEEKYCFASTRGAAKWLFWTSPEWKPAAVTFDRHEFRLGKTEVRVFLAFGRLFGHIRRPLGSMFEDVGHIRREIEHKCKQQDRTFAILLEKRQGFALPAMATKSTRWRRERLAVRFLHQ